MILAHVFCCFIGIIAPINFGMSSFYPHVLPHAYPLKVKAPSAPRKSRDAESAEKNQGDQDCICSCTSMFLFSSSAFSASLLFLGADEIESLLKQDEVASNSKAFKTRR